MDKTLNILKEYFGYSSFRTGQKQIIDKILEGQDVLGIMPTGAGKSLCFQIPALTLDGTTIVISPLISLMKDQVDALCEMGIKAAFINSSLSQLEYKKIVDAAKLGEYKLIYIAPERLETDSFYELTASLSIPLIVVDEAHCVSEWGHDFRPSYTRIAEMIGKLPKRPVVSAFTATATPKVKEDIEKLLNLKEPYVLITGFDRENLYLEVRKPSEKLEFLLDYIKKHTDSPGVVYCATRKTVEMVCERLGKNGILAARYHAGLSDEERTASQEAFLNDKVQIIVATNAFGMGIDKSNTRFVLHYNMPKTIENYYQEAGRAGRDGERAECVLLYSAADVVTNKLLIENAGENADKSNDYKKLQEMVDYCNTDSCLRSYILSYFGEEESGESCDNCINCLSTIESTNITTEAQKILSCIRRMGERFGSGMVTDVLRGSKNKKLLEFRFNELPTYGLMKEYSEDTIKELIAYMLAEGYIAVKGDKYPVLSLNARSYSLLKGAEELYIKRHIVKEKEKPQKPEREVNQMLFSILRDLRKEIADEHKVPPFIVFSDATLSDMCRKLPTTHETMLLVSGVGKAKLESYGQKFIEKIKNYLVENNIEAPEYEAIKQEVRQEKKKVSEPQKDTRLITYELYTSGKSVEEICKERGLSQVTIEGHLIDCLDKGMELDYTCFVPQKFENEIKKAIETYGTERLKPIKEALSPEITYTMIRFAMWKYKESKSDDV